MLGAWTGELETPLSRAAVAHLWGFKLSLELGTVPRAPPLPEIMSHHISVMSKSK